MGFIEDHRREILEAFSVSGSGAGAARILLKRFPEHGKTLRSDSFRKSLQYLVPILQGLEERDEEISKLSQETEELKGKISKLRRELKESNSELARLSENRSFAGWTVRTTPDGRYFRLYKSMGGKVHSIHVGRDFDPDTARRKVLEKLDKLRQEGRLAPDIYERARGEAELSR